MSRYTDRITNYHAGKPKFFAHVDLSTRPLSDVSDAMSRLIPDFDIDTAVGVQLDVVGEWVGRSRRVATPVTGIYFSWDTERVGWDQGVWQGPYDPNDGFIDLSDEIYRLMLKVKVAINNWEVRTIRCLQFLMPPLPGPGSAWLLSTTRICRFLSGYSVTHR